MTTPNDATPATITPPAANADGSPAGAAPAATGAGTGTSAEGSPAATPPAAANDAPGGAAPTGDAPAGEAATTPAGTPGDPPADPAAAEPVVLTGAPETYADWTVPEGLVLEPEVAAEFRDVAKAMNLSQAGSQRAVDLASKLVTRTIEGFAAAHAEQVEQWLVTSKSDPEVGGAKFDANVIAAQSVIAQYGTPALKEAFDQYGLGNHPEFLRFALRIAKASGESGFVHGTGQGAPEVPKSREQALADRIAAEQARNPPQSKHKIPS
jgi:hypothetical protein